MSAEPLACTERGPHRARPTPHRHALAVAVAMVCAWLAASPVNAQAADDHCPVPGTWLSPGQGESLPVDRPLATFAERPVVLLGEVHDSAEHHRWQLQVLAGLHAFQPNMAIGFESFPRRVQPVLDDWVAGRLDERAFLEAVEWRKVWGFDSALYLPLLHFARQNRVPIFAMNVERALVARVGREGWAAIPADEREGLSDPAPPAEAYIDSLARVYTQFHPPSATGGREEPGIGSPGSVRQSVAFQRFVQAQQTWDRAMAQALADARGRHPGALIVGIVGRGHLEYRWGIPAQLDDLGIADSAVLLPVNRKEDCASPDADLADALFVVEEDRSVARWRARLGVSLVDSEDGVRVARVLDGSVAEAAGITVDDIVALAAGTPVRNTVQLVEIIQRMAPGTWLPMTVIRKGEAAALVARFPGQREPAR